MDNSEDILSLLEFHKRSMVRHKEHSCFIHFLLSFFQLHVLKIPKGLISGFIIFIMIFIMILLRNVLKTTRRIKTNIQVK